MKYRPISPSLCTYTSARNGSGYYIHISTQWQWLWRMYRKSQLRKADVVALCEWVIADQLNNYSAHACMYHYAHAREDLSYLRLQFIGLWWTPNLPTLTWMLQDSIIRQIAHSLSDSTQSLQLSTRINTLCITCVEVHADWFLLLRR